MGYNLHRDLARRGEKAATLAALITPTRESAQESSAMFVYLIHQADSDYVKIGIADDPPHRLRYLQTGNPQKLFIACLIACESRDVAIQVEHALHIVFADFRVTGEWFRLPTQKAIGRIDAILSIKSANLSIETFPLPADNLSNDLRYVNPPTEKRPISPEKQAVIEWLAQNPSRIKDSSHLLAKETPYAQATIYRVQVGIQNGEIPFATNGHKEETHNDPYNNRPD